LQGKEKTNLELPWIIEKIPPGATALAFFMLLLIIKPPVIIA
jgi:hypothetical protein